MFHSNISVDQFYDLLPVDKAYVLWKVCFKKFDGYLWILERLSVLTTVLFDDNYLILYSDRLLELLSILL